MKKIILSALLISGVFAAFLPNKTYTCTTLGISFKFKDKNQTVNIPNTDKTKEQLKKVLKNLYTVSIKIVGKNLDIKAGNVKDTMRYVKKFKSLDVFATNDNQIIMFLDSKHTQAAMNIVNQQTMIFYQCK